MFMQHGQDACLAGANNTRRLVQPGLNDQQVKAILMQGELAKAKVLHHCPECIPCNESNWREIMLPSLNQPCVLQVLRVVGIEWLFGAWADVASEKRFERRLDRYGSIWCCVDAHPGHILYDFFFDQAPHQDRHGRMKRAGGHSLGHDVSCALPTEQCVTDACAAQCQAWVTAVLQHLLCHHNTTINSSGRLACAVLLSDLLQLHRRWQNRLL
jgi:hypothetical protein